jgi:hypothetical protein
LPVKAPYRVYPDQHGGYIYQPVLNVNLALNKPNAPRTKRFEAVIDSGASRCVFHSEFAIILGIDLRSGTKETTNGIGGPEDVWLHDVTLYVPGGPVVICAGFKENLPVLGLLGMTGFFEHFDIFFDSSLQQVTLDRVHRA